LEESESLEEWLRFLPFLEDEDFLDFLLGRDSSSSDEELEEDDVEALRL